MIKECEKCNNSFETKRDEARFCNHKCYSKWLKGRKYSSKTLVCENCSDKFVVFNYVDKKYCSHKCYWETMKGRRFRRKKPFEIKCKECSKVSEVYPSFKNKKFCDRKCFIKHARGENHHCWQGGKSSKYDKLRRSKEWRDWRKKVFERDKYTCRTCGFKNGKGIKHKDLHPHHIKSASKYLKLVFVVKNGITLCRRCHGKIHSINFRNGKP